VIQDIAVRLYFSLLVCGVALVVWILNGRKRPVLAGGGREPETPSGKSRMYAFAGAFALVGVGGGGLGGVILFPSTPVDHLHEVPVGHYIVEATLLPSSLSREGAIIPEHLEEYVRGAIVNTVGPVLGIGSGSDRVVPVTNVSRSGIPVTMAMGQWVSDFRRTPPSVLEALAKLGADAPDPKAFQERQVVVRYWSERHRFNSPPGQVFASLDVFVRADAQNAPRLVPDQKLLEILAADLVDLLRPHPVAH